MELPPPQPMMRLMIQMSPNPAERRNSLLFHVGESANTAARPLRRLIGHSGFVPNGKKKTPTRLRVIAFGIGAAAPESDGDRVRVAVEVAPLARFTVAGCSEQE